MADWEGFTEADLQKLDVNSNQNQRPKIVKPVKRSMASTKSKLGNPNKNNATTNSKKSTNSTYNEVPPAALLTPTPSASGNKVKIVKETGQCEEPKPDVSETAHSNEVNVVVDDASIQQKEKLKLEDVHLRQKQMEEKNRRKKAMLTKEIAERKKRALAESSKLVKIQSELTKLDQLLNFDVNLLRDKIDNACLDFSNARKRFDKAEAEYVAAKIELHNKTILKEDLTEHLYNLIQANEERKAKKLEELMHQLNVEEEQLEEKEIERARNEKKESNDDPDPGTSCNKNNRVSEPPTDNKNLPNHSSSTEKENSQNKPNLTKLPVSPSSGESLHGADKATIAS